MFSFFTNKCNNRCCRIFEGSMLPMSNVNHGLEKGILFKGFLPTLNKWQLYQKQHPRKLQYLSKTLTFFKSKEKGKDNREKEKE